MIAYVCKLSMSYCRAAFRPLVRGTALFFVVLSVGLFAKNRLELAYLLGDVVAGAVGAVVIYPLLSIFGWLIHVANEARRMGIRYRDVLTNPEYQEILQRYVASQKKEV